MLPIEALFIRLWATMFPPSSSTAIFIGCPISLAFFSAALITRRASSSFTADIDSSLQLFHHIVWRPEVRELVQQVAVRPDLIRDFSVRVDREEKIDNVVRQCAAIVRVAHRLTRVIRKNVRQQRSRDVLCLLGRVAARVFQFVCEHANEAIVICWLAEKVILFLLPRQEDRLQWSSTSVCLDPAVVSFVHGASPNSDLVSPEF